MNSKKATEKQIENSLKFIRLRYPNLPEGFECVCSDEIKSRGMDSDELYFRTGYMLLDEGEFINPFAKFLYPKANN